MLLRGRMSLELLDCHRSESQPTQLLAHPAWASLPIHRTLSIFLGAILVSGCSWGKEGDTLLEQSRQFSPPLRLQKELYFTA